MLPGTWGIYHMHPYLVTPMAVSVVIHAYLHNILGPNQW